MKRIFILIGILLVLTGCNKTNQPADVVDEPIEKAYKPQFEGSATLSVEVTGDYKLKFNVNNEGTIYYMIQPWYEVTEYDVTPEDIKAGRGQEFIIVNNDGEIEENPIYVVSVKEIQVENHNEEVIADGYMGDIKGQRPPEDDKIQFSSVVWYVFEDIGGNYSDVLMLSKH